mmetsp:Transcript_15712/g.30692  ORF Transcript_15712/g.30692 Transcript_15712/m.30692 type:complete len:270 (+) Transcript_15712:2-811(+)
MNCAASPPCVTACTRCIDRRSQSFLCMGLVGVPFRVCLSIMVRSGSTPSDVLDASESERGRPVVARLLEQQLVVLVQLQRRLEVPRDEVGDGRERVGEERHVRGGAAHDGRARVVVHEHGPRPLPHVPDQVAHVERRPPSLLIECAHLVRPTPRLALRGMLRLGAGGADARGVVAPGVPPPVEALGRVLPLICHWQALTVKPAIPLCLLQGHPRHRKIPGIFRKAVHEIPRDVPFRQEPPGIPGVVFGFPEVVLVLAASDGVLVDVEWP